MNQNGSLKTDEIALAVYLVLEGFDYTLSRSIREVSGFMRPTVTWIFPEEARSAARLYWDGEARVDPSQFTRTWGVIRREMFDYLKP
jgi:hypothetical protein